MSHLSWTLVALLIVSTALFAVGVVAERSDADTHVESAAGHAEEIGAAAESEGAHEESGESGAGISEESGIERAAGDSNAEDERVLGVDLESTPLVVLAVIAGLGLAAMTATRFGRLRGVLLAVMAIALLWAALDIREVVHQLDESRTGVALLAMVVAALHLAVAAISVRLARPPTAAAS